MTDLAVALNIPIQVITNIVVSIGVIVALITFIVDRIRYQKFLKHTIFRETDESFVEFHKIMMSHPDLPISIHSNFDPSAELTREQKTQVYVFFHILVSAFERTYFLFQSAPKDIHDSQWPGWERYFKIHCGNRFFRDWWRLYDYGYDREFTNYFNRLITEQEQEMEPSKS